MTITQVVDELISHGYPVGEAIATAVTEATESSE